jgi:hypothetical protein
MIKHRRGSTVHHVGLGKSPQAFTSREFLTRVREGFGHYDTFNRLGLTLTRRNNRQQLVSGRP